MRPASLDRLASKRIERAMSASTVEFGWCPSRLDFVVGNITLATLDGLDEKVAAVRDDPGVDREWIYAPLQQVYIMGGGVEERPFPSRVFGLAKTHSLTHANPDGPKHLDFLVWALSFFMGMRLTTTEAGFLDATPIKPRKLIDFVLSPREYRPALAYAEAFWQANKAHPARANRWVAAVHTLFIAQYPNALQFERFIYLYGALDACFALAKDFHPPPKRLGHDRRVSWMCSLFNMPVPAWADAAAGPSPVSVIRNATLHESLFMDAPLGFALHGVGTNQNLPLEMEGLICRFLVALIGDPNADYVRAPVTTRQMQGWSP
jgi:hypothetical protein